MFFTVKPGKYVLENDIKTEVYLKASFIINNYPFKASEICLDRYLKQKYKIGLKKMCLYLLLKTTINKTKAGDFILVFNDINDDAIARLITYGNGIIPGCKILLIALNQE